MKLAAKAARNRDDDHVGDVLRPETRSDRRQQHDAHHHQRAERLEASNQVHHHEHQEEKVGGRAQWADRGQEAWVEAFEHERPVDDGEGQHGKRGDGGDQDKRGIVKSEHRAEQHVQQVDAAAFHRDDQHSKGERDEVEGGKARVLAQDGRAGDETGEQDDRNAGDKSAETHGRNREAGDEEAYCRAGQDRVAHRVAHQAQAAEHEEYADRWCAERERKATD